MDTTIKIGGEAGQGIQTIGETLARVFTRTGYYVFTNQDYESRVRGGHNYYQIRISDRPISSPRNDVDILVALDRESILQHEKELAERGRIIYDSTTLKLKHEGSVFLDIPFENLAIEHGGDKIMANTVATGAVIGLLNMDISPLHVMISETFSKKGEAVVQANKNASQQGHAFAVKNCASCSVQPIVSATRPRMLMSGIDAISVGALVSGCKFYAAYPMTPSTGIMNYLAARAEEHGIVVEQAEDEIAAINMVIGASYAGVRAMTGTSGGGFALMVEGVSLAAMTETPIVIAMGQRPGPATGLPTKTEQGDLQFILSAGHGEFPRIVFAPGSPRQAFYLTNKAFDLSEKYQVPVFILFDTYLADTLWTLDGLDAGKVRYLDYRLRGETFKKLSGYKRHAFSESGISLMGVPGEAEHLVVTDSDEHDEDGHLAEDAQVRVKMTEKRLLKKLPLIKREISPPFVYGDHDPRVVLTGWGSTYGVMKDAVDMLSRTQSIAMLHFSEVFPFPPVDRFDYVRFLKKARHTLCIENNATGQFERLMRAETGYEFTSHIHKFDGRPFTLEALIGEVNGNLRKL